MRWEYDDAVESFLLSFVARSLPDVTTFSDEFANEFSIIAAEGIEEGEPAYEIVCELPTRAGYVDLCFTLTIAVDQRGEAAEVSDVVLRRYGQNKGLYLWSEGAWVPAGADEDGHLVPVPQADGGMGPAHFEVF